MLRKSLIVCLALLCLSLAALAEEEFPYFSDICGVLPDAEDRSEEGRVLQTYTEVSSGDYADFSLALMESGFSLSDKTIAQDGAVQMTFDRQDAQILTELLQNTLRVSCPDARRDEIALSDVGDVISLGAYAGEDVNWVVLEDRGNCLLLVTEKVIEAMPYHETCEDITWKRCTLREWLNTTLLEELFDEEEQEKLLINEAGDKISLLTGEQALLTSAASPTDHALENGCNVWENGCSWYYLRDSGYTPKSACCVRQDGEIFYEEVACPDMGVRAAILYKKGVK